MPFASSSSAQIAYIEEVTFGTIPVSGNPNYLRVTGESLDYSISKEMSAEINATRTISSMIPVTASSSGGLNCEISYREYDPLLAATLQSTYTVYGTNGVGTSFTADFTATTITASVAPTGGSAFTALQQGQWFQVQATGNANDKKIFRVSTVTAPTSTVITLDANTPATVGTSVAGVAISTSRLTHGTTQRSYTIERQSPDITEYWAYTGMTASSFDMSIASGSLSSMNFNFMGKAASRSGTATLLPGTAAASKTHDIHSGVSGSVCVVRVNGAALVGTFVKDISFTFDNALRSQEALCTLGAVGIGSGTINATGNMNVYLADGALFDSFIANTNISLEFSTFDGVGNGYVISLPNVNLTKVSTTAGSKDQDMMLAIEFTALRDAANATSALQKLIFIDRMGVAAA